MNARGRRPAERLLAPPGPLLDSKNYCLKYKKKTSNISMLLVSMDSVGAAAPPNFRRTDFASKDFKNS